jgi:hypothetical protein
MNHKAYLIPVLVGLALALGVVGGATAQGGRPSVTGQVGVQAALGTGFTYQGQLKSSGSPVNGSCAFDFGLWDAASGGGQLGITQTVTTTVMGGLFTVVLNDTGQFGGNAFNGNARYLGIGVKCGSESVMTSLGRQALQAAPYALYAASALTATTAQTATTALTATTAQTATTALSATTALTWINAVTTVVTVTDVLNAWSLTGNAGTNAGNFLGTTDNMTLTLAVSNTAALRLVPNTISPNLIGGYSGNNVSAGVTGATIGGGGASGAANTVTRGYGTVGGGFNNSAGAPGATVGGGANNITSGLSSSTVAGGYGNTASRIYATVGGGESNTASGDVATVSGGLGNIASGSYATIPGGWTNTASGQYSFAAGRQARAIHDGAFVWGDNSTANPISSTTTNQFVVRASGGVSLTVDAGESKAIDIGEHYRDNAIVAWGKVTGSTGAIAADFGVLTVTHSSTGNYLITLEATAASAAELVPIANIELDAPAFNATDARLIYIDQKTTTQFGVYITNGNYIEIDNDFTFIVTGR